MSRTINVEISFGGLCLLDIWDPLPPDSSDHPRPQRAGRIDVYLVDTSGGGCDSHAHHEHPAHLPALAYYAADHLGMRCDTDLVPSPLGTEIAIEPLQGKRVDIIPPYDYRKLHHTLEWGDLERDLPRSPREDRWLRWVLGAGELWGGRKRIDPCGVAARVDFHCGGTWRAKSVFRNREVDDVRPIRWRIDNRERAMARDVVCRLYGLRHGPTIRLSRLAGEQTPSHDPKHAIRDIVLTPGPDDLLRFSITNLSQQYGGSGKPHLRAFAAMLDGVNPDDITLPEQVDQVACQGRECEAATQP